VSGVVRVVMLSIAEVVGKPPTEGVFFEKYARISVVIDEVVNEGMLEAVDRDVVRKGTKGKVGVGGGCGGGVEGVLGLLACSGGTEERGSCLF